MTTALMAVRNARIVYTVPTGGAGSYAISVAGASNGAYTVLASRTGASALPDASPFVVDASPMNGQAVGTAPTTLDLIFSEAVRSDSVATSDLVFSEPSVSVDSVQLIDGQTARFTLTVPSVEATYDYTLTGGSVDDLQGNGIAEFTGSFAIDQTGPQVSTTSPASQTSSPYNELTFVFDEAIDPASVSLTDVILFNGPNGSLLGALTGFRVDGANVTFEFADQITIGLYTMEIGPNIQDLAGNLMDQDGNGTGGQISDTYSVQLLLQSPDLTVSSVSGPASAEYGDTIDVVYTVTNIGTDPALESWNDRIYLSDDAVLDNDDRLLATVPIGAQLGPLDAAGGAMDSYTRSESVTLPLDILTANGTRFILVQTDALGTQPETNETNNIASQSIDLAVPPLPDLQITDIDAPVEALSGEEIQISWTVTNNGHGGL